MAETSRTESLTEQTGKPLTFKEACRFIDCSPSHLYKLTHRRLVPYYKPNGKRLYFRRQELEKWIFRNPIKTAEEIDQQAADHVVNGRVA
jgi:excisionase family DNA binding protein